MVGIIPQLLMVLLQFVIGLLLSIGSVYIGLKMFDKLTEGIDEWKEIQKGNVAVGIVMTAVIISIALVIKSGVLQLTSNLTFSGSITELGFGFVIGLFNLLIGLGASVLAIYVAIKILDRITVNINEMKEIQKGNVAVALVIAGVLLAVSFVISASVDGISHVLDFQNLAKGVGLI